AIFCTFSQMQSVISGVRAYRGLWWLLGFRHPQQKVLVSPAVCSPGRQNLSGRKRLRRVTRLLLSVLPQWVQGALGYPVSSSIGRAISPEIRVSPTKPCGKGSKRKHVPLMLMLSQPSTIETESDEYHSHNDTESDLELKEKGMVIIEDVIPSEPEK
uniref:Uncharacterized protein n=1 Tax=Mola mola TaxID=94237 RepID=A0A3Q3VK20_MOLML